MSSTKKIVLFIVEGPSDVAALGPSLARLLSSDKLRFKIMGTDLTSDNKTKPDNIKIKLEALVTNYLGRPFKPRDLKEVIFVTDTDGAFIPSKNIIHKELGKIRYAKTTIEAKDPSEIAKRNIRKSDVLKEMSYLTALDFPYGVSVPFRVFFNSCNLDHVLHNNPNLNSRDKVDFANNFSDGMNTVEDFTSFFTSSNILVGTDYDNSWEEIQIGTKSLQRGSNLGFYLLGKA